MYEKYKKPSFYKPHQKNFNEKVKGAMRKTGKGVGWAEQKRKEQKYSELQPDAAGNFRVLLPLDHILKTQHSKN